MNETTRPHTKGNNHTVPSPARNRDFVYRLIVLGRNGEQELITHPPQQPLAPLSLVPPPSPLASVTQPSH